MKPRGVFEVTEYTNESGSTSYRVTGTKPTGERVRKNFSVKAEADGEKQRLEIEAANLPPAAGLQRTPLTPDQLLQAERAFDDLKGKRLDVAVRFYLDNYREASTTKTIAEAFAEFISAKEKANRRHDTLKNLRDRVGRFAESHGARRVSEILPQHIFDAVHTEGRAPQTILNERTALHGFFRWCERQGYCAGNPVKAVDAPSVEHEEPTLFTLDEVRRLMASASAFKDGKLVPYFALGIFAGIRPRELSRLSWEDVDLKAKLVWLRSKSAKKRGRRTIEIANNLVEWLKPHAANHGPIVGKNFRKDFDRVRKLAGWLPDKNPKVYKRNFKTPRPASLLPAERKEWAEDVMRHTALSFHYAKHKSENLTAAWAGNSPDVMHGKYKNLVSPKDANAFWNIRPGKAAIVQLKAA